MCNEKGNKEMQKSKKFSAILGAVLCASILVTGCGNQTDANHENSKDDTKMVIATLPDFPEYPVYDALDCVTLNDYDDMAVSVSLLSKDDITDEQVRKAAEYNMPSDDVTDGEVQTGDTVIIDYVGKVDGKEFEGGSAEDQSLTIGSGRFIDGFEDGVIGMKVDETKDLKLTFPEDYGKEDLNGKDVVFTVTVHSISRKRELNDANVKATTNCETVDAYLKDIRESMELNIEEQNQESIRSAVSEKLVEECKVDVPDELIAWYVETMVLSCENTAKLNDMNVDELVNSYTNGTYTNMSDFKKYLEENSAAILKSEVILHAIAEKENISVSDEAYEAGVKDYVISFGASDVEELHKYVKKSNIESELLGNLVLDKLAEQVTIVEITSTEK